MVNRSSSEILSEAPWPVAARKLLTAREQSLYDSLSGLYPRHRLFVQVALSQLIDVDWNHPECESIRARYKQLVADFVLCRPDLSVVAVIELDDRSHRRRDRQDADARKTKALVDAGLRLVRIPAGDLPSEEALREIVGADRLSGGRLERPKLHGVAPGEPELRLVDEWVTAPSPTSSMDHERAASRAVRVAVLKMVLAGVVLVGGWFAYTQLLPVVLKWVFQPLAIPHAPGSRPANSASTQPAIPVAAVPVVAGRAQPDLVEKTRAESEAAALQRQKAHAWLAYYAAPASCEHPIDWKAQVECGNQYMRAKKEFEKQWLGEHPSAESSGGAVVLDNGSIGGRRK